MKISIFGAGYVGLTTGACLANLGHQVLCVDVDEEKIKVLNDGEVHFYEPGLKDLVQKNREKRRLSFTINIEEAVVFADVIFNCVGTPSKEDGSADLSYVFSVAKTIGQHLDRYKIIVNKSTVPPGTARETKKVIKDNLKQQMDFDVVSNPEFLREGNAIRAFNFPDKIVIGSENERPFSAMRKVYSGRLRTYLPIVETNWETAELIKYANNTFLATKISFINEMANICSKVGADIKIVSMALGMDYRISPRFLNPGVGYGGSCLREDALTLVQNTTGDVFVLSMKEVYVKVRKGENLRACSFSISKQCMEFKKIKSVSKRAYKGDMVTVRTRMNKTLTTTADHPFIVLERGEWKTRLANELAITDCLPSSLDMLAKGGKKRIDVINTLSEEVFDFNKVRVRPREGSFSEIKDVLLSAFPSRRNHDILRSNCMNLKEFLQIEKKIKQSFSRKDLLLFTSKGNTTYCEAVLDLDEDFCILLGYYVSEGNIHYEKGLRGTRARIGIHFNINEQEYITEVMRILQHLNISYTKRISEKNNTATIIVSSRIFAYVLDTVLGCGTDSYSRDVPDLLFSSGKECQEAFLRGVFRGDGHIAFPKKTNSVVYDFGSVSYTLVKKMVFLFQSLGVVPSYKLSRSAKSTVPAHFLRISTKKQIEKLRHFKDKTTQEKVDLQLAKCSTIKSCGFTPKNSSYCVVAIKELSHEYSEENVYSFEVEDNHTFVTDFGLIVHNCFPKDVKALIATAKKQGYEAKLFEEVDALNERQKVLLVEKVKEAFKNDLSGKILCVLGLSFKPGTSDVREAPSLNMVRKLIVEGANVNVYDPVAMEEAKKVLPEQVSFCRSVEEAVEGSSAIILVTEWDEFRNLNLSNLRKMMADNKLFDGRNVYEPEMVEEEGFEYFGIGRGKR